MAVIGVRISWLMLARKSLLARVAASAWLRAASAWACRTCTSETIRSKERGQLADLTADIQIRPSVQVAPGHSASRVHELEQGACHASGHPDREHQRQHDGDDHRSESEPLRGAGEIVGGLLLVRHGLLLVADELVELGSQREQQVFFGLGLDGGTDLRDRVVDAVDVAPGEDLGFGRPRDPRLHRARQYLEGVVVVFEVERVVVGRRLLQHPREGRDVGAEGRAPLLVGDQELLFPGQEEPALARLGVQLVELELPNQLDRRRQIVHGELLGQVGQGEPNGVRQSLADARGQHPTKVQCVLTLGRQGTALLQEGFDDPRQPLMRGQAKRRQSDLLRLVVVDQPRGGVDRALQVGLGGTVGIEVLLVSGYQERALGPGQDADEVPDALGLADDLVGVLGALRAAAEFRGDEDRGDLEASKEQERDPARDHEFASQR